MRCTDCCKFTIRCLLFWDLRKKKNGSHFLFCKKCSKMIFGNRYSQFTNNLECKYPISKRLTQWRTHILASQPFKRFKSLLWLLKALKFKSRCKQNLAVLSTKFKWLFPDSGKIQIGSGFRLWAKEINAFYVNYHLQINILKITEPIIEKCAMNRFWAADLCECFFFVCVCSLFNLSWTEFEMDPSRISHRMMFSEFLCD